MNASGATSSSLSATPHTSVVKRESIPVGIALCALLIVVVLALMPASRPAAADRITLLFLSICGALCAYSPLSRVFETERNAASFGLMAAMFAVYGLARTAAPADGLGFALKGEEIGLAFNVGTDSAIEYVSYAGRIVVLCAIVTLPFLWRHLCEWTKAILLAAAVLGFVAIGSFYYLSLRYPVGVIEVVDPTPLVHFGLQLLEYTAVALLCNFVSVHPTVRRVVLRALPVVLIALWLRYQFMAPPAISKETD
jgi:hypothetical protein